ncbi:hypothetical protein ACE1N8_32015 [Streptomyces sp. DSM 116494]|uniref:hypothetical protein n=1 Tax=Streptomyces okerensis TaxID=3344655 RepID=UPI00388D4B60
MHDARASTASVTVALHDVAGLGGFFALQAGGRTTAGIRSPAPTGRDSPISPKPSHAATALRSRASTSPPPSSGTPPVLWSPALARVVLHGIVPDLEGPQRADDGPALRVPRPAGWYADRLDDGPARALYQQVTRHLSALAGGVRRQALR